MRAWGGGCTLSMVRVFVPVINHRRTDLHFHGLEERGHAGHEAGVEPRIQVDEVPVSVGGKGQHQVDPIPEEHLRCVFVCGVVIGMADAKRGKRDGRRTTEALSRLYDKYACVSFDTSGGGIPSGAAGTAAAALSCP